jgi:dienelactone hydrolase
MVLSRAAGALVGLSLLLLAGAAPATAGPGATAPGTRAAAAPPGPLAGPLAAGRRGAGDRGGSVVVDDIQLRVPGQPPVAAFLVRPRQPQRGHASVLFLHWFEPGTVGADRTEFLAEAVALAGQGTVSLLPQGQFPWSGDPVGDARDVASVHQQLQVDRVALDLLLRQPGAARGRAAVVGHDYGAMYGALLADADPRVTTAVLATPDATWSNWFITYWLGLTGPAAAAYDALFAGLDPAGHVGRLGDRLFLQFAGRDVFVDAAVRARFAAAAPQARLTLYPAASHQLDTAAQADRLGWLRQQLHLGP